MQFECLTFVAMTAKAFQITYEGLIISYQKWAKIDQSLSKMNQFSHR